MHVTFRQLKVFEAVARHLNFTRAAEDCNVAQPSLMRSDIIGSLSNNATRSPQSFIAFRAFIALGAFIAFIAFIALGVHSV